MSHQILVWLDRIFFVKTLSTFTAHYYFKPLHCQQILHSKVALHCNYLTSCLFSKLFCHLVHAGMDAGLHVGYSTIYMPQKLIDLRYCERKKYMINQYIFHLTSIIYSKFRKIHQFIFVCLDRALRIASEKDPIQTVAAIL